MVINSAQLSTFKSAALKRFEEEMLAHVREFFPHRFRAIGENDLRRTVHYGYRRARSYGFESERNVCMYLNNMLWLGSNFDRDPAVPWASEILRNAALTDVRKKIDLLSERSLAYLAPLAGPDGNGLRTHMQTLVRERDTILQRLLNSDADFAVNWLTELFPGKARNLSRIEMQELLMTGTHLARPYGIRGGLPLLLYAVVMFLLGSGFDTDPQFSWAAAILNDRSGDELMKARQLYAATIDKLGIIYS